MPEVYEHIGDKTPIAGLIPEGGIIYTPIPNGSGGFNDRHATLDQLRRSLGNLGTWDVSGAISQFDAIQADTVAGTVATVDADQQTLTPAATLPQVGTTGIYHSTATRDEKTDKTGTRWSRLRVPARDTNTDTVAFLFVGLMELTDTFEDVFNKLGSTGIVPGDGSYALGLQLSMLGTDITLSLVWDNNGTASSWSAGLTDIAPGQDVYLGVNFSTREVLVKRGADAAQVVLTLDQNFDAVNLKPYVSICSTAETISWTAPNLNFDLGSDDIVDGQPHEYSSVATPPADAADNRRYLVTGTAQYDNKRIQTDDVVEFYNDTNNIVVYRHVPLDDLNKISQIDVNATSIDGLQGDVTALQTEKHQGVIRVDGLSASGSLTSSDDGKIYMAGFGATSGDLATAGFVEGDLYIYHHGAAEPYEAIPMKLGQMATFETYDITFGGTVRLVYYYAKGLTALINYVRDVSLVSNSGPYMDAGWVPHPDVVSAKNHNTVIWYPGTDLSTSQSELNPKRKRHSVSIGESEVDVNGEHFILLDTAAVSAGQEAIIELEVRGGGAGAGIATFVLPDGQKVTLGGPAGTTASQAIYRMTVTPTPVGSSEPRVWFEEIGIHEWSATMSRNRITSGIFEAGSFDCWEGRSFLSLNNGATNLTDYTINLPDTPKGLGGDQLQSVPFEVMFEDFAITSLTVNAPSGRTFTGKALPSGVSAGDVLRFMYVEDVIVFLGTL